jgi:hypothetical protein
MLAQKKVSKKKNKITAIIIVIVLIATAALLLIMFVKPGSNETPLGAFIAPTSTIPTTINKDVLDDARVKSLKQFGPGEVEVQNRGRSDNPFKAF